MKKTTCRTLKKTPRGIQTVKISGMEVFYYNVKEQIESILNRYPAANVRNLSELHLQLNLDGIPLFKSSPKNFWPLLITVRNLSPVVVVPLSISSGPSKPEDLSFLEKSFQEISVLRRDGINFMDKYLKISNISVVVDIPARSFMKGAASHSGFNSCGRCKEHGYKPAGGGICFKETDPKKFTCIIN